MTESTSHFSYSKSFIYKRSYLYRLVIPLFVIKAFITEPELTLIITSKRKQFTSARNECSMVLTTFYANKVSTMSFTHIHFSQFFLLLIAVFPIRKPTPYIDMTVCFQFCPLFIFSDCVSHCFGLMLPAL